MPLSERFYLADAVFVAALEGDNTLIGELHAALRTPVYPTYLGRRSCPPTLPLELAVHPNLGLHQALRDEPWHASAWYQKQRRRDESVPLTVLTDAEPGRGDGDVLRDQLVSFSAEHRRHALRTVISTTVEVPNPLSRAGRGPVAARAVPSHDPFGPLEEDAL